MQKRICSVLGCNEESVRSISLERVERVGMKVERLRRVYLCEKHYKEFKKKNRKDQRVQRWRWNV